MAMPSSSCITQINDLLDIPLHAGSGASVYLRDVGSVKEAADVLAGYALLNGKRTVYIPVTKRPDASTITVVNEVRQSLISSRRRGRMAKLAVGTNPIRIVPASPWCA
jgi:multidrug efflux pump subunit AcrB